MKYIFKVTIFLKDGSNNDYNVVAIDDVQARTKAEKAESQSWREFSKIEDYPGIDFCEIKRVCNIDVE